MDKATTKLLLKLLTGESILEHSDGIKKVDLRRMRRKCPDGMIPCLVEEYYTAWLVTFKGGDTLLLQSESDQASFAVNSGAISAPKNWDGTPEFLGTVWEKFNPTRIRMCSDEYLSVM